MKKNSGQVLILFVILIPIMAGFLAIIGEAGYLLNTKSKCETIIKEAINYSLNNLDNEDNIIKTKQYIYNNIQDIDSLDVEINDDKVRIIFTKQQKSIFTNLYSKFKYTIKIDYIGYEENNKLIIKE